MDSGQVAEEADVGMPLSHCRCARLALGLRKGREMVGNEGRRGWTESRERRAV
jgi:hypothetical protein